MPKQSFSVTRHGAIVLTVVLLSGCIILGLSCRATTSASKPRVKNDLSLEMKDSSGKAIAQGTISLPSQVPDDTNFTGSCQLRVLEVPAQPSSPRDYVLRTLSQNDGAFSGRMKDGRLRLALHPQIKDNTIYLEGQWAGESFTGKWYHQTYAGYEECGTFSTRKEEGIRPLAPDDRKLDAELTRALVGFMKNTPPPDRLGKEEMARWDPNVAMEELGLPLRDRLSIILKEIETVKPGMTRGALLNVFKKEGGISTRTSRQYVYRTCPYIKVDVTFEAVGELKAGEFESAADTIKEVSKPYLQWTVAD